MGSRRGQETRALASVVAAAAGLALFGAGVRHGSHHGLTWFLLVLVGSSLAAPGLVLVLDRIGRAQPRRGGSRAALPVARAVHAPATRAQAGPGDVDLEADDFLRAAARRRRRLTLTLRSAPVWLGLVAIAGQVPDCGHPAPPGLERAADRLCACDDMRCAESVMKEISRVRESGRRPNHAQRDRLLTVAKKMADCQKRLMMAAMPPPAPARRAPR
ncbi:MAG TPA: hypothetical protein VHE35_23565 [Kofleriaceae bacterium]|nr:hypothetical protein [Kofleriaceae bacterium]